MINSKTQRLVFAALFAALTFVGTMIIRIPTPGTSGYIHLGDTFVVLSGIILGPVYGALAAGIGSALADLIGGYFLYIPATFIIKALIALGVALIYHKFTPSKLAPTVKCIICGIYSTLFVAIGYFIFEVFIYGAGALASVPANLIQGVSGLIFSTILLPLLLRVRKTA
ncbi:MAG: ECF transporter S component [Lachnospiraceae bacterium]|jgi:uncharacterized membrane protein